MERLGTSRHCVGIVCSSGNLRLHQIETGNDMGVTPCRQRQMDSMQLQSGASSLDFC